MKKKNKNWGGRGKWVFFAGLIIVVVAILVYVAQKTENAKQQNVDSKTSYEQAITGTANGKILSIKERAEIYNEAIRELEKKVSENPQDSDALLQLASAYYNTQNFTKSIDTLKKASEQSPKDASILLTLANTYRDTEDKISARTYYDKVLKLEPDNTIAKNNLAGLSK